MQEAKLPASLFPKGSAIAKVEGSFPGEGNDGYSILSFKSIRLVDLKPIMLVQTDRQEYRPGQVRDHDKRNLLVKLFSCAVIWYI